MKKKDKILVAVTVIMVLILIVCFYFDRSSALLSRTLAYDLPSDVKLVDIDKHGFLFYRVAYEAKFEIDPENPEELLQCFVQGYEDSGRMLSQEEFDTMTEAMYVNYYDYVNLKPNPAPGSHVWFQEADTPDGHHVMHFMDVEEGEQAYLYIYYVR